MMVGRWVSLWDCLFLGAMLNFRGVVFEPLPSKPFCFHISKAPWHLQWIFFLNWTTRNQQNDGKVNQKKCWYAQPKNHDKKNKVLERSLLLLLNIGYIPQKVVFQTLAFLKGWVVFGVIHILRHRFFALPGSLPSERLPLTRLRVN